MYAHWSEQRQPPQMKLFLQRTRLPPYTNRTKKKRPISDHRQCFSVWSRLKSYDSISLKPHARAPHQCFFCFCTHCCWALLLARLWYHCDDSWDSVKCWLPSVVPLHTDCHPACERFFPCSPVSGTRASCSSSVGKTFTITGVFFFQYWTENSKINWRKIHVWGLIAVPLP